MNRMAGLNLIKRVGATRKMRVGRGGKRGKTAGRGTKGQSARAGNKKRPEMRDIIKRLPKRRGYGKNRAKGVIGTYTKSVAIPVGRIDNLFAVGAEVNPTTLAALGLAKGRGARFPQIKIVSGGDITKKFAFTGVSVSASAKVLIEKAGGSVV
jgi:large subunit ribosomal protein L15